MTHLSSEAERLADWLQATVNMYPQMSEDEPGGYATEFDQKVDEAAALLRRIPELEAELEAAKLGEATHDRQATEYAQRVAHWIGKFDEVKAERDRLRAELEGRWLPIGFLWRHKDEPDSQYRFCSDLKQAEDAHLLMHTDVILVCPAKSTPTATQGSEA